MKNGRYKVGGASGSKGRTEMVYAGKQTTAWESGAQSGYGRGKQEGRMEWDGGGRRVWAKKASR